MAGSIVVLMEKDKSTKNTQRFQAECTKINDEDTPGEAAPTLYVQNWALEQAGQADVNTIKVTIEIVE